MGRYQYRVPWRNTLHKLSYSRFLVTESAFCCKCADLAIEKHPLVCFCLGESVRESEILRDASFCVATGVQL